MFDKFKEWYEDRHEYAKKWKEETGGKVLGYFCTYAPEELIYAAGVLPVRILGSHEPHDVTEPYIIGMYCPFCRDVLAQGLKGRYPYLDGIMIAQSCLHLRQSFGSWRLHVPTEYSYYLYFPHGVQSKRTYSYLTEELKEFKKSLEEWTGNKITDDKLEESIALMNENRKMMRDIYELRKSDNPSLTGLEAMYMVVSSQLTHKKEHNAELKKLLNNISNRKLDRETGTRLMMIGSENDDIEFVKMIESFEATVVTDDHCTGSRYFWNLVESDGNPLERISARYIDRPACPNKDWPSRKRYEHIINLAKDYNIQAALIIQQKFCDPHELDIPPLREILDKNDIPSYFFELDVTVPIAQFKIRFEAFLEMLKAEELPF
jgi:benzoyl-CoA reductase subunit C